MVSPIFLGSESDTLFIISAFAFFPAWFYFLYIFFLI